MFKINVYSSHILSLIRKQVSENVHEKVQRKQFTCNFSYLHELLLSKDLKREFAELMSIPFSLDDVLQQGLSKFENLEQG